MSISIINADIVTAFGYDTEGRTTPAIGTKVTDPAKFWSILKDRIAKHNIAQDRAKGQHFLVASELHDCLLGGVGKRTVNSKDYIPRLYRGKVSAFLRREHAELLDAKSFIAAIVYTREAYFRDPDVLKDPKETQRIQDSDATHVLVAIIAGTNYMSPGTAIHNIAGFNNEWLKMTAEELREKAKWVDDIDSVYCVVAD